MAAELSDRTAVRVRIGAILAGMIVFAGSVWNVALFSNKVDDLDEGMQEVLEGQRLLLEQVITKEQAELYMRTAEALNEGWKAPPIR